jgi:tyrosine-protein kinase Etk/Wzc
MNQAADRAPEESPPRTDPDYELGVLDLLIALTKRKWLILGTTLVAAILAAIWTLRMPEMYTAAAKVLPPQQSQSAATSLLSQIGQVGSLFGGALGLKNPTDIYVGMLRSRRVAEAIVNRFGLVERYRAGSRSDAVAALTGASQISVGKDGLISVEVNDVSPQHAAELANAYVEELDRLTGVLAVTEAGQRRLFFERQLKQAKDNLLKAELAARDALDKGGIAAVDAQGRAMIQTSATLRARVTAKEVELNAMRAFATEQNPQFNKVQQELVALREELGKVERGQGVTPNKAANELGIGNVAMLREVKYQEVLFELLARQFELAKIDEARDSTVIQVLDDAIPPERRSGPKRTQIVLLTALVAAVFAVLLALVLEAYDRARHAPETRRRLDELSSYLWRRRR